MEKRSWIAVVVTTYNNPKFLEICLRSLYNQSYQNFEVFIADDGSNDETRDLVLRLKKEAPFHIQHFWHPDQGYRKARINNIVFGQIDEKKFPVIVCVDHDVILHCRFIEDHYRIHEQNNFNPLLFMGRRVDLDLQTTELVSRDNVCSFNQGFNSLLLMAALRGRIENVMRSVRMDPPRWLLKLLKRDRVADLLGSNFSISTRLLKQVNGYNEDFKSYWGEDGDLFVRVRNTGAILIGKIGYAVQWHMYHQRLEENPESVSAYRVLLKNQEYQWCPNGILKGQKPTKEVASRDI